VLRRTTTIHHRIYRTPRRAADFAAVLPHLSRRAAERPRILCSSHKEDKSPTFEILPYLTISWGNMASTKDTSIITTTPIKAEGRKWATELRDTGYITREDLQAKLEEAFASDGYKPEDFKIMVRTQYSRTGLANDHHRLEMSAGLTMPLES
jgi:hypothetical protein